MKDKWDNFDHKLYQKIKFHDKKTMVLKVLTTLACTPYFIVLSVLLIFLLPKGKALAVIIGLLIDALIVYIVKHLVKRDRPNIKRLVYEKGYSYISGHTFTATFFYGLMLSFISNYLLAGLLIVLVLIIAYSRIYLGVHYLSDIIGGILLGISYLTLYIYLTPVILNILHIN